MIALLAKQDALRTLERVFMRSHEDRHSPRPTLSLQRQRRLSSGEVHDLVSQYIAGSTVNVIARPFGIHRNTVPAHLDHAGVARRRVTRWSTDPQIAPAAQSYSE